MRWAWRVYALLLVGCAPEGQCIDAPEYRSACTEVTVPVVVHSARSSLYDEERTDAVVSYADDLLSPHGIRVEIVEHTEDFYLPVIVDDAPECRSLGTWDNDRARDGRLHVYVMDLIHQDGDKWYDGVTSQGMIALAWRAKLPTLAHEIGHVLGERHTVDPGNLMYEADHPGDVSLTDAQAANMLSRACARY